MKRITLLPLAALLALGGCSLMQDKKIDYKSAGSVPTLEAPPDLILPSVDNRYTLPNTNTAKGAVAYSNYDKERVTRPAAESGKLLPSVPKTRIERAGTQRWLVVEVPAQDVWPVIKDYWQEMGFIINVEMPEAGVIETDWAENRAKIPQDALRNFLSKAIDGLYSTAERDKFRTRVEPTADSKGTEIYISHRGMVEVFEGTQGGGDQGKGRTVWQPRPADPELEAEMLRRMMVRFGVEETRAQTLVADKGSAPKAAISKAADTTLLLTLPEPFDRAWRRVGLALDRIGFAVEDRDRVNGLYYVRYVDPDTDAQQDKKGFLSKLAFWRGDKASAKSAKYQVRVGGKDVETQVSVLDENGKPARNETGSRIVNLLYEQLK
ncbi:MAG: outer membrane protein assembly factor BamC [Hydrogenophilales bacterium]|nr:outer membrane protein assembly factor BamC [Hydrogenophilales bacterium]